MVLIFYVLILFFMQVCGTQHSAASTSLNITKNGTQNQTILNRIHLLEEKIKLLEENFAKKELALPDELPTDCLDILRNDPGTPSGPQDINVGTRWLPLVRNVYCDMDTDGGGWTVIQRRIDGTINFYQNYETYANGFGFNFHEFWIGNENLNIMTSRMNHELRIDLESHERQTRYAKYSSFRVDSACNGFRLHISGYSGNAGDSMAEHNGMRFSTYNKDQDENRDNCAVKRHGAWWYRSCGVSSLNGLYLTPGTDDFRAIQWYHWFRRDISMKSTTMRIRPAFPFCPL